MSNPPAPLSRPVASTVSPEACRRGAETLVAICARLQSHERAYIVADATTRDVAEYVVAAARAISAQVEFDVIEPLVIHGATPPENVGRGMQRGDVIFGLTRMSLAHTQERQQACLRGARYLSLPDYSLELLGGPSLQFDFAASAPIASSIKRRLDSARTVRITTPLGTDLRFSISGRSANACPGICWEPGTLGSPPDSEVNTPPLEYAAEGTLVVDASIPCREIGVLEEPITLTVRGGAVVEIDGPTAVAAALRHVFDRVGNPDARQLAEFGIGLNTSAEITGRMLDDEGCAGTVHFGFGSNATIGGRIRVPFHLDFVVRRPDVYLDDTLWMQSGECEERG